VEEEREIVYAEQLLLGKKRRVVPYDRGKRRRKNSEKKKIQPIERRKRGGMRGSVFLSKRVSSSIQKRRA